MKYILLALSISILSGCCTTAIVEKQKFPSPPTELMQDPVKLKPLG